MLKNSSFLDMLFWNLVIVGLWHVLFFVACQKLPDSKFSPERERYSERSWEHGGRWYRENLKIQLWKDKVPQHIGKEGFSKEHLTDVSIDYLDRFILETCRGEWLHWKDCLCALIAFLIDPLLVGLVASFLILLANLPFAMIQRYNRFRLQVLRKKRIRDLQSGMERGAVTA